MTEEFWTEARVAELKQLYVVEHRSRTEIMRILQITRYNLAAELNKLGLCINDAHHLTEEERGKIVALCHAGHSLAEIGRQMGAAGSTIKNVLARVQLRTMPSTRVMAWTEEEKSALVTMVGQGMGYKEIAGSTIFAGRRSLLAIKHKTLQLDLRMKSPSVKISYPVPSPEPEPDPDEPDEPEVGVHFFDINERTQCRWPVARMRYCGAPRLDTAFGPYCKEHAEISMRPLKTLKTLKKDKQK